jgi:predicted enzyme related to lactoylglutathione lyase
MKPVTWFSLPTDNMGRAIEFYRNVFDWDVQEATEESDALYNYHVMLNSESDDEAVPHTAGRINGCLVHRDIGLPHPAVLGEVEDLDKAVDAVIAHIEASMKKGEEVRIPGFRPGRVPAVNPAGVAAWVVSSAVGIVWNRHSSSPLRASNAATKPRMP